MFVVRNKLTNQYVGAKSYRPKWHDDIGKARIFRNRGAALTSTGKYVPVEDDGRRDKWGRRKYSTYVLPEHLEILAFPIDEPLGEFKAFQSTYRVDESGIPCEIAITLIVEADDILEREGGLQKYIICTCPHCGNTHSFKMQTFRSIYENEWKKLNGD